MIYRICVRSKHEHVAGMKHLVAPNKFRQYILSIVQNSTAAGHVSHMKTSEIFHIFLWLGVVADVRRYCLFCLVCLNLLTKAK